MDWYSDKKKINNFMRVWYERNKAEKIFFNKTEELLCTNSSYAHE